MGKHRNSRARLSKRPSSDNFDPELDGLLYLLRDNLGKADAFITAVEALIERPGCDDVERMASLLGLISKSATIAMAAFHRLHGAVADTQTAPAGESWDYKDGTASGG